MGLRKAIDLTIAYPDATSTYVDLAPYNGLAIAVGANKMASATGILHLTGSDSSAGTYYTVNSNDSTVGLKFSHATTLPDMGCYPRWLKVTCDATCTAAAGQAITAYVNMVNP